MNKYQLHMQEVKDIDYTDGCEYEIKVPSGKVVGTISITGGHLDYWNADTGEFTELFGVDELGFITSDVK